jgi:hypothetical protein
MIVRMERRFAPASACFAPRREERARADVGAAVQFLTIKTTG